MPSCLQLCLSYIFAWFLQMLILIFCTLWVLMGYTQLRSILHLSTQSLQLVMSFRIIHLLQPRMVPTLPMSWRPLSQCSSLVQQNEVPMPVFHKSKTFIFKHVVQPKFQQECSLSFALAFGIRKISQIVMFITSLTTVLPSFHLLFHFILVNTA